jgi:hypothetical protein
MIKELKNILLFADECLKPRFKPEDENRGIKKVIDLINLIKLIKKINSKK